MQGESRSVDILEEMLGRGGNTFKSHPSITAAPSHSGEYAAYDAYDDADEDEGEVLGDADGGDGPECVGSCVVHPS